MMTKKRLLVFGASGFVGGHVVAAALQQGWQVTAAVHEHPLGMPGVTALTVDIAEQPAVERVFQEVQPDAVVLVAAFAHIDQAQRERERAWQVNVLGASSVAACCSRANARCIFLSSDAVFDGLAASYSEEDIPNPLNFYGFTKWEGEQHVLAICPAAVVVRVSLVLGFPVLEGNAFMTLLDRKLSAGQSIFAPGDEIRTPIDVTSLSEILLELADEAPGSRVSGILHVGSPEPASRFDLTCRLAEAMGYSTSLIASTLTDEHPGRAPRHKRGVLNVQKAQQVLKYRLPGLEETIQRAVNTR